MKAGAEPTPTPTASDEPSSKCGCLTFLFGRIFDKNGDGKVELGEVVAVGQDVATAVEPIITEVKGQGKGSTTHEKKKKRKP